MAIEKRKEWLHLHFHFHVAHHQNLCWQLIHALNLETKWIRNILRHQSVYCGMYFSFLRLSSNSLLMESLSSIPNVRCILALRRPSSAGMIAHIHTAARYVKGRQIGALQCLTDSRHHHHHHHRVSSARGLSSNFWTCLNDHRKWNVLSYYRPCLEDGNRGALTLMLSDDLKHFGVCLHKSFIC